VAGVVSRTAPSATRAWRTSAPGTIEADLSALWAETARDAPVARALMSNLVVYLNRPAREETDLAAAFGAVPIDEVARRHPSRVLVLQHTSSPSSLKTPIGAAIAILVFGPTHARVGVEEIAINCACADESLASIVRALTLGDVPTSIWWASDLSRESPLTPLLTMGRQFLYDSRQWSDLQRGIRAMAAVLEQPRAPDLADLNWRRLTPMRQALTHALGPALRPADIRLAWVHIGHQPGDATLASLLCGWLCARLGWRESGELPVSIEEGRRADELLWLEGGSGAGPDFTATMNAHRVLVEYSTAGVPFSVAVPHETDAEAIAAELRALASDVCLHDSVRALTRRFDGVR
jgi:glucose-6-phosphate dehydrogenase assembly protein OpcA